MHSPIGDSRTCDRKYPLSPSQFTANIMRLPVEGKLLPFSFKGHEHMYPIYNTNAQRVLLVCGRQTAKSTTLGNISLTYSMLRKHFNTLFVSPTQTQTKVFSRDKIETAIANSPGLRAFNSGRYAKENILYKRFITQSTITLRYAFLHADRVRGIFADMLLLDELQDILQTVIPVIEETLFTSPYKIRRYSGTPKSMDNTIAYYWENYSTQNEWVIPCDHCGGGDYRYWNVVGFKNIGPEFLRCAKCSGQIYPRHTSAQWASMNPFPDTNLVKIPYEGYRIPQPITCWVDWDELVDKKNRYTQAQFYNEVLGLGYETGNRPLSKASLKACCDPSISIHNPIHPHAGIDTYMGIDWGGGSQAGSYTLLTMGRYIGNKFTIFYAKRFVGDDSGEERMIKIIHDLVKKYHIRQIGTDFGGGHVYNDKLVRLFGKRRVISYQYANTKKKLYYDDGQQRFMVNRTPVLMDMINAINRGDELRFPNWEEWEDPFGQDMVSIFKEYNEARREDVVNKVPGTTDDTLHSVLYCFLASMIKHPRPDILSPTGEG
jgi:hypothetical protein